MFKITPIQSKEEQIECARLCGTVYREGLFAYSMRDAESGEVMGFAQFEIAGKIGVIYDLCPVIGSFDTEAMFILGRATMNFIDMCGTHKCRAEKDASDEKLLHAIGFRQTDAGDYFCDMTGFFDGHCDSK